jgi:hypothetical protein
MPFDTNWVPVAFSGIPWHFTNASQCQLNDVAPLTPRRTIDIRYLHNDIQDSVDSLVERSLDWPPTGTGTGDDVALLHRWWWQFARIRCQKLDSMYLPYSSASAPARSPASSRSNVVHITHFASTWGAGVSAGLGASCQRIIKLNTQFFLWDGKSGITSGSHGQRPSQTRLRVHVLISRPARAMVSASSSNAQESQLYSVHLVMPEL